MTPGCFGSNIQLGCLAHHSVQRVRPASSSSLLRWRVCHPASRLPRCQQRQVRLRCHATSGYAAPVPGAPVPGDHHGALIHQLLQDHSDEVESYVREGLQEALEESKNGKNRPAAISSQGSSASNELQSSPGPPEPQAPDQFIPHRWRIIAMMSLAFILCNMDKVQNTSCAYAPRRLVCQCVQNKGCLYSIWEDTLELCSEHELLCSGHAFSLLSRVCPCTCDRAELEQSLDSHQHLMQTALHGPLSQAMINKVQVTLCCWAISADRTVCCIPLTSILSSSGVMRNVYAGQHVSCRYPNGGGAWVEQHRPRHCILCILLGLLPHADSSGLHLHQVDYSPFR